MKKLTIIGAAFVAIAAFVVAAPAAGAKPVGMSQAEYQALMLRSQGLNDKYGVVSLSGKPAAMSAAEYRALMLRSEGLNQKYGITGHGSLTLERGNQQRFGIGNPLRGGDEVGPATSTDSNGVQWRTVGIGLGALLGFAALLGTAVFGVRHRGQLGTS